MQVIPPCIHNAPHSRHFAALPYVSYWGQSRVQLGKSGRERYDRYI